MKEQQPKHSIEKAPSPAELAVEAKKLLEVTRKKLLKIPEFRKASAKNFLEGEVETQPVHYMKEGQKYVVSSNVREEDDGIIETNIEVIKAKNKKDQGATIIAISHGQSEETEKGEISFMGNKYVSNNADTIKRVRKFIKKL